MKLHRVLLFSFILFHKGIVWSKSNNASFFETLDECEETNNLTSLIQSATESSHPEAKMETYDITETLISNLHYTARQFVSNLKNMSEAWVPTVLNSIARTNMTLEHDNKSILFSNIIISGFYASSYISLNCEFSEYLQIKISGKGGKLQFSGDVYTNKSDDKMGTGQFAITVNEIGITIMAHKDSSNDVPLNQLNELKIDISYKNYNIESNVKSDQRSITTKAIGVLFEKLKSLLKSTIKQNFSSIANRTSSNAFLIMHDICMHPKSRIVEAHPAFASSEKYYYFSSQPFSAGWDSIELPQNTIKTYGLSNYKSFKIEGSFRNGLWNVFSNFTLSLQNLHGYANWSYWPPFDLRQIHILKFKIDSITVTLKKPKPERKLYFNEYLDVNIKFAPLVACVPFNDSLASFARALLLQNIKESISRTITAPFREQFMLWD